MNTEFHEGANTSAQNLRAQDLHGKKQKQSQRIKFGRENKKKETGGRETELNIRADERKRENRSEEISHDG